MRLLLCATALLLLGACSSDPDTGPTAVAPTPGVEASSTPAGAAPSTSAQVTGSGAAKAGDAALRGNTEAICAQAARVGGEAAKTFAADLKVLIDAQSSNDPNAAAQAKQKTTRDVENYGSALDDMSKLTTDADLKKALTGMGKEVAALDGDVRKLNADKVAGLQEKLAKACGAA